MCVFSVYCVFLYGAHDQDRTDDLVLTKDVLCQLSYMGVQKNLVSYVRIYSELQDDKKTILSVSLEIQEGGNC